VQRFFIFPCDAPDMAMFDGYLKYPHGRKHSSIKVIKDIIARFSNRNKKKYMYLNYIASAYLRVRHSHIFFGFYS
jgi:hypothetical protein